MPKPQRPETYFRPRNWERWQRYAKRNPTWIRLHIAINRDPEFMALTPFQRCLLLQLWVLYADYGKPLPYCCGFVGRQLTLHCPTVGKALKVLLSSNFIELCDRDVIKTVHRVQIVTETETETEKQQLDAGASPDGFEDGREPPPSEPVDRNGEAYVFTGTTIRLNRADYDRLRRQGYKIKPFDQWLADYDEAISCDPQAKKSWWHRLPKAIKAEQERRRGQERRHGAI